MLHPPKFVGAVNNVTEGFVLFKPGRRRRRDKPSCNPVSSHGEGGVPPCEERGSMAGAACHTGPPNPASPPHSLH